MTESSVKLKVIPRKNTRDEQSGISIRSPFTKISNTSNNILTFVVSLRNFIVSVYVCRNKTHIESNLLRAHVRRTDNILISLFIKAAGRNQKQKF